MAITVRSVARDSMPERLQVTQDLERRFREQEQAKQAANAHSQPIDPAQTSQSHR